MQNGGVVGKTATPPNLINFYSCRIGKKGNMIMGNKTEEQLLQKWRNFSKKIALEGDILLKNDNGVLPFGNEQIAVFGQAQFEGRSNADLETCIIDAFQKSKLNVNQRVYRTYEEWLNGQKRIFYRPNMVIITSEQEMPLSEETVKQAKDDGAEKAVVVLCRKSGENSDMVAREGDYYLSSDELKMITTVCNFFEHVVLILRIGMNIDLGFLEENRIEGIVYVNYMGDLGAPALVDLLTGAENPSGKLPFTMARHIEDYPAAEHFGQHGGGLIQDYYEDIFVGYRWFDTFNKQKNVVFPFGWGLSYTDFSLKVTEFTTGETIRIVAEVKNIGKVSGRETVQCYVSAPNLADGAKLGKPIKELCEFAKTGLLAPGQSENLTFDIDPKNLGSYDDIGVCGTPSVWLLEKGSYHFNLTTNGRDFVSAGIWLQPETCILRRCPHLTTTLPERLLADGTYEKLPTPSYKTDLPIAVPTDREGIVRANDCFASDVEIVDSLSVLKRDQSAKYRLMPGAGGSHTIAAVGGGSLSEVAIAIDGAPVTLETDENGQQILNLPLGRCIMSVTALCDGPKISSFIFHKVDVQTQIRPERENIIQAQNFYEGSFCINVDNYPPYEGEAGGSCVTNFVASGMNVLYKLNVEKDGNYDIAFRYAFSGEPCSINSLMTLAVSNIARPIGDIRLEKTYEEGKPRRFRRTNSATVILPKGTVYLKLVAEKIPFPDLSAIYLTENEAGVIAGEDHTESAVESWQGFGDVAVVPPDDGVRTEGILLKDIAHDPSLMSAFLAQLTNRELAVLLSGTGQNKTVHGQVGCNHPLYFRGVPPCQTADGSTGLSLEKARTTQYPSTVILTATFDKEMYATYGDMIGEEGNLHDIGMWLAPAINIFRDPRGGRNYGYSSEDPYLSGIFAAYQITALQNHGVGAVLKHYCANNSEYERLKSNSRVSERALREIYMKGFEIAVHLANPWGIMTSYNYVNDIKTSCSRELIVDVARDEWNWDGVFFTDWWNDSEHIDEVLAGHDLKMATGDIEGITAALDDGRIPRERACESVKRILKMLIKLKSACDFMEQQEHE